MAADTIYLPERLGTEPDIESFWQQIADRKTFHDEFEQHMCSAFEVMKARRPSVVDHLPYEEFEEWLADRIRKRGLMRSAAAYGRTGTRNPAAG